jgi:hypothetical protein
VWWAIRDLPLIGVFAVIRAGFMLPDLGPRAWAGNLWLAGSRR